MSKSPGHQRHPEHKVQEFPSSQRMVAEWNGQPIAESADVIRLEETGYPPRYYFPRSDVRMENLQRSPTTSRCPFKGEAHYFSLVSDGGRLDDAVWTYEEPYEEHPDIKNRLAFWEEKSDALHVHPA